ncbi:DUF4955 domain-containing protein [Puteibacter caeruleilacunae]|nr:DUF4955 domain-containing protein [Puteibacter caeruleilacunae]
MNDMNKYFITLTSIVALFVGCTSHTPKNNSAWIPNILKDFKKDSRSSILPDFSYAGYHYGEKELPTVKAKEFVVTDYGAIANDEIDDTKAIQKAVDAAGANGGGIVLFPTGKFLVNTDTTQTDIVKINYSNIVMRGAGSGKDGTIIFSGSSTHQQEDDNPWLSPFVFHTGLNIHDTHSFYSVTMEKPLAQLAKDLKKGDDVVELSSTEGLKAGDVIILAMKNTTEEGDLINDMMKPLKFEPFQKTYLEAGKRRDVSFQWPVEVEKILDGNKVKLKQPSRRDILVRYEAYAAIMPMLKEIGVEHFRFESSWDGVYKHHGNREMDYGWGAVCMHRVAHGWVKDLSIDNYTQTTHMVNSRNITITDITITGGEGHYGPKMYHSSDNLITDVLVDAKRTHGPGLEGESFGNVYKDITYTHDAPLDLHGISGEGFCPPMFNLYENIKGVYRVAGGGAPQNIPHSGDYNTFWNMDMSGTKQGEFREIFHSWIWTNPEKFKNEMHYDCHKQYLRSIVVGVRGKEKPLSVDHQYEDLQDQWIYVEGLNKAEKPVSLYETQLAWRLKK